MPLWHVVPVQIYAGTNHHELMSIASRITRRGEWALVYDIAKQQWEGWTTGEFRPGSVGPSQREVERLLESAAPDRNIHLEFTGPVTGLGTIHGTKLSH